MSCIETYVEGEKLLCFHGPLIYEAKCLQVSGENEDVRYLVHYYGWNKKWDEWVPESRMLKYTEKNLKTKQQLQAKYTLKAEKKKNSPAKKSAGSIAAPAKKSGLKNVLATPIKWRVAHTKGAVKKTTIKSARTKPSTSKSQLKRSKVTVKTT